MIAAENRPLLAAAIAKYDDKWFRRQLNKVNKTISVNDLATGVSWVNLVCIKPLNGIFVDVKCRMYVKKTSSFMSPWDYGEIFFNAWIRAKPFLTSLELHEFAPAGTETKSPTLHHARLLSLAGDLACWLHHRSCSAPPTSSFHVENLFSRTVFRLLFTRTWNDGVVWLVNDGKSDP